MSKSKIAQDTDENTVEQTDLEKLKERPLRGRGGRNNFGVSHREEFKSDKDKALISKLLNETYVAYTQQKVRSDEELVQRLDDYFRYCAENGIVPCVEEMASFTGYSQATVWDWEKGRNKGFSPETSEVIKKAKDFMKTFDAKLVLSGKLNPVTYFFRSKNYYGMRDVQEVEVTANNASLTSELSEEELAKRLLEDSSNDIIDMK